VNIGFPQLNACLTTLGSVNITDKRVTSSSGNADQQAQSFTFIPYDLNPSDWPCDPNLNQITFAFRWGPTVYSDTLYIGPEELPLKVGTKLVLTKWSSRPGSRFIIQPVKDKPRHFRLVSADDRKLCMSVESMENPIVTLTDQRGENTLLICELNSCGVSNGANHHYKFVCSNLYLGVRSNSHQTNLGAEIIQAIKDTVTNSHERTAFRLVSGGINVDMSKQPSGDFRQIYSKLHPAAIARCICNDSFEVKRELQYHQTICQAYAPVPRKCRQCTGYVLENGPISWTEHAKNCAKNSSKASPNQCTECMALYTAETLKSHKCPGVRVPDIDEHLSRAKYLYGKPYGVVKPKVVDSATATANKKKVDGSRAGCSTTTCHSDVQVCWTCKEGRGINHCMFCGTPKDIERVKCCDNCKVKEGGGDGKITGRLTHASAVCIHCGTQGGPQNPMSVYHICYPCKTQYGQKCYYNYCLGLESLPK